MIEIKSKSKSNFVGYLGIKNYSQVEKNLVFPLLKKFFDARKIKNYKAINENAGFADLDFNRKNFADFFSHFYNFIVDNIHKDGGQVEITITYCITLDETNCSKICEKTLIRYDEIMLYQQPVFYFIYVDIKDIFNYLRTTTALIDGAVE
ncbi:MAG: hypothetical protein ACNA7G_00785 [Methylobacter sp.]